MPIVNPKVKIHALITRPEKQGRVLAQKCLSQNIEPFVQPMFEYRKNCSKEDIFRALQPKSPDTLIFVSVAAVELANKIHPLGYWSFNEVIAVGNATQSALERLGIKAITPELHTSEGLLLLTSLQSIKDKEIIIVRGNGGRELIEETLTIRGANVQYLEVYKRLAIALPSSTALDWKKQKINCIVITSNALLESVVNLIDVCDNYWRKTCLWVVASHRIAKSARALGIENVVDAKGAHDEAILTAITQNG